MTEHQHSRSAGQMAAVASYERHDVRQRDIVDRGISVQQSCNTMSAVEFLMSHDIDAHVIARVLLEPGRRRGPPHH
jgi:hypothetical protein